MGGSVCGTTGTYVHGGTDYRDTDWYQFTVATAGEYVVSGGGEQELQLFVVDHGDSSAPSAIDGVVSEAGCGARLQLHLDPGTYSLFAAPTVFTGMPCAPGTRDYWVRIEPAP